MARKRKLLNITDRCRLCLSDTGAMSDLFVDSLQNDLKDLMSSTSIDIKNEHSLPTNVCHVCLYKLNMWSEFKEQFIQSNQILLTHLGESENFDYIVPKSKMKLDENEDIYNKENDRIVSQTKMDLSVPFDFQNKNLKENILDDEISSSKESSQKMSSQVDLDTSKENLENDQQSLSSSAGKVKQATKRGKISERREASTKRWVARKKALIAATGEEMSDSESGTSDDTQLSPVQKARAKTNAEKEAEKQRRLAKALKNLEIDMPYDLNFDKNHFRGSNSDEILQANPKTVKNIESNHDDKSPNHVNKIETLQNTKLKYEEDSYVPRSIRSELEVGDATYIVTSTLFFADSPAVAKRNDAPKDASKNNALSDYENNEEQNTDIFEAVQLRRINPKIPTIKENNFLERCLNIEVEGSELEALQHVQQELATFVEKDMRQKMNCSSEELNSRKTNNAGQTLEQQLKIIVEKAIRTNYEASQGKMFTTKETDMKDHCSKSSSTAFVEAAMQSHAFQPKVVVDRLNVEEARKMYSINNIHTTETQDFIKSSTLGKRQSLQPIKYVDYDTSAVDVSDELMEETKAKDFKYVTKTNTIKREVKKYGPASSKIQQKLVTSKTTECDSTTIPLTSVEIKQEPKEIQEKHMCGICSKTFENRKDIEIHVKIHKPSYVSTNTSIREEKKKRMRCKRCHEIVEARFVKLHVCSNRQSHRCNVCKMAFRTEKQLKHHLVTHQKPICKMEIVKEAENTSKHETVQVVNQSNTMPEKTITDTKKNIEPKQTYTCFLCDKTFTDEDVLKDHLQKHCDEISEDDENNGKEEYQCAICGDTLESEEALESHVEKHLFDDEDDNPNLITITNENETAQTKKEETTVFQCPECPEIFSSEVLLVMHQPLHEEEAEIAEWEKQSSNTIAYACNFCDAIFTSDGDLSEHLYVHNESTHMCLLCEQPFDTLEQLQEHVATH